MQVNKIGPPLPHLPSFGLGEWGQGRGGVMSSALLWPTAPLRTSLPCNTAGTGSHPTRNGKFRKSAIFKKPALSHKPTPSPASKRSHAQPPEPVGRTPLTSVLLPLCSSISLIKYNWELLWGLFSAPILGTQEFQRRKFVLFRFLDSLYCPL